MTAASCHLAHLKNHMCTKSSFSRGPRLVAFRVLSARNWLRGPSVSLPPSGTQPSAGGYLVVWLSLLPLLPHAVSPLPSPVCRTRQSPQSNVAYRPLGPACSTQPTLDFSPLYSVLQRSTNIVTQLCSLIETDSDKGVNAFHSFSESFFFFFQVLLSGRSCARCRDK